MHIGSHAESYPLFAAWLLALIALTAGTSLTLYFRRRLDTGEVTGSTVLGPGLRSWYFDKLEPFENWCVRRRVPPAALTYAQLVGTFAILSAYASGILFDAGWLLLGVGSLDIIDGRVARRTGTGSDRGAFLDSVVDRYADTLTFIGLAIYFRHSWVLWLVLFALLGASMVSYTRARAESLGVECKIGTFQRPERTVILGFGTLIGVLLDHMFGAWLFAQPHSLLVATLFVMAVFTNVDAVRRFLHVDRALRRDSER